ncbi:PREDICTED: uncharacterized protein LOC107193924 [Dufourea novaeangliae]|uniref:uncharacterized protein LOC107193924 n=1 Tax=Dufourea novaeangliae TaxID=178035 RepID=UPI000767C4F7|nr:PREDICTED: uncharacterized protein LOC107193924 [Dufourea novaeangliae]
MATLFESSFLSSRLHRIEQRYEEPANTFGKCDCTSYSYLALSVVLFTIGTAITIFALGDVANGFIVLYLGHMWLIGPIFICSGLMVAVKCMLYLRRKSVIEMIFHQRQLFRHLQELTGGARAMGPIGAAASSPPSYEVIVQETPNELPPPSYAEAVALLHRTLGNDAKSSRGINADGNVAVAETVRQKP